MFELISSLKSDLKEHCSDCSVLIALSLDQVDNAKSMDKKTNIINNLEKNWASSTKTRKLIEILTDIYSKSIDTKILVFSQFTTYLDIIQIALKQSNLDFRYARYDGSMNAREKESSLDSFRSNPTTRILLISLKSGSVGLNLVTANHLILTDLWWNPAVEEQAIDRGMTLLISSSSNRTKKKCVCYKISN